MNVALPGNLNPFMFLLISGFALAVAAMATFIFYKKD
jgi:Mg2+ and Co2+ transporter CorA